MSTSSAVGKIIINTDGLCEPNPGGWATWGWAAATQDQQEIDSSYGCIGHGADMSNNVAEYRAVLEALLTAKAKGWLGVLVRTDSNLVVQQVNQVWGCNAKHLILMRDEAIKLLRDIGGKIEWIPRERNQRADELTRIAYAENVSEAEQERPKKYKMKGTEYDFKVPTTAEELRRLEWLAANARFRPEWQKEANRLLNENTESKQLELKLE